MLEGLNKLIFFWILVLFFSAGSIYAQTSREPISLEADPEYPSPGEEFTVEASTPTFNPNTAVFNWTVNNRNRSDLSGLGQNSITLTAGSIGSITNIKVRIITTGGVEARAEKNILVSGLTLVWSADTYVPKWYKGKALPVPGSTVNITAIPDFVLGTRRFLPGALIYRWSTDGGQTGRESFGRQTFSVQMPELTDSSQTVSVTVEDPTRQIKKTTSVVLNSYTPKVLFYKSSPLGGGEYRFSPASVSSALNKLVDFVTEPFFFSVNSKSNLLYRWLVAGTEIQGQPQDPSLLTIDTGKIPHGEIPVSLYVSKPDDISRPVNKSFDLIIK